MNNPLKQSVGIDVSKDTLDIAINVLGSDFKIDVLSTSQFTNNREGIKRIMNWIKKFMIKDLPLQVVLEATGVYHELVTNTLHDNGFRIAVVMANKIKNYVRSTDVRSINDKISAKQIAEFGLVKNLENWEKPDASLQELKVLSRERLQLIRDRTRAKNQQHAMDHSCASSQASKKRINQHLKFLDKQINQVEKDILTLVQETSWLNEKIQKICTIKGIGVITVISIIAETDGFNLIRNIPQLVCYAGYDVVHKESGTSVKTKARISHKGNKHIRQALYFPALSAVKYEKYFTKFYDRLFDRQKIKMKSYVAVQRKLLILIYVLWKKNEEYKSDRHNQYNYLGQPKKAALTELDHVRS
ncbi:IS110 family transposase [Bacteroidota bacterium]